MSEHEEQALLRALTSKLSSCRSDSVPSTVNRLYRKLTVRRIKRENNVPLLSLLSDQNILGSFKSRILDRYKVNDLYCFYGNMSSNLVFLLTNYV